MRRADVTLITPYPTPAPPHGGRSGVAGYSRALAHALTDRGADVTVLAPAEAGAARSARDGAVRVERP
ncbi:MAG: hypothetical protein JWQ48_2366, partial [Conexibacter sp.]|nr:hypothetical protein [Conexibacter sp.]